MSSFCCEKCGTECLDSSRGYTTGCEHYPADTGPGITLAEGEREADQDLIHGRTRDFDNVESLLDWLHSDGE